MKRGRTAARTRRGSVIMIVLWAIGIAAMVTASVQLFSYRQAAFGLEAQNRIQARWAARAGVESMIAMMALHTEQPIPDDAFALIRDMESFAVGEMHQATYDIRYRVGERDYAGPMDEHSRINVNRADGATFSLFEDITPDVVAAIEDWRDDNDDASLLGAESDWYLSLESPYEPRNGDFRSVTEMELVAGIGPNDMRGEDWNLNHRLDPNEDDGDRSFPYDEPDGYMETGWGGLLTAHSRDGGATASGLERIYLRFAEPWELQERIGVTEEQASVIINFGKRGSNSLTTLITTPLSNITANGVLSGPDANPNIEELTDDQLRLVLSELSTDPLYERNPGRVNLNTASEELIEDMLLARNIDEAVIDEIIYMRNSRAEGLTSILDLRDIPDMQPELLEQLSDLFTTSSNVYTISAKGRSDSSGLEVEMIVTVDRSSLPVKIVEYREQ